MTSERRPLLDVPKVVLEAHEISEQLPDLDVAFCACGAGGLFKRIIGIGSASCRE